MKIEIRQGTKNVLTSLINSYLLSDTQYGNALCIIREAEFEEVEEEVKRRRFAGYKISKEKVLYLTHMKMVAYNADGDFIGSTNEEHLTTLVRKHDDPSYLFNFMKWRKNWVELRTQMEKFGTLVDLNPQYDNEHPPAIKTQYMEKTGLICVTGHDGSGVELCIEDVYDILKEIKDRNWNVAHRKDFI